MNIEKKKRKKNNFYEISSTRETFERVPIKGCFRLNHFVSKMLFIDAPNKHDLFVINTRSLHLSNLSFRKQKVA